jgi:integrase
VFLELEGRRITFKADYTKTGQTRYVPINDTLLKALSDYRIRTSGTRNGTEYLFPAMEGMKTRKPHIVSIQRKFHLVRDKAKIKNFRLYDLRHTYASKLVMKGVSLYAVAELLGRSDVSMTTIYAHQSP